MSEEQEQIAVIEWLERQHPEVARRTHHSPNGGLRSAITAARLKRMGTRRGFPDLLIAVRRGKWTGLVIEMKAAKGRVSHEQREWLAWLQDTGYMAAVAFGADEAIELIRAYLRSTDLFEGPDAA